MTAGTYLSFLGLAVVLVLVPGPDFAVVTKNTLVGGRARGLWASLGVTASNVVQGAVASLGLGALIVRSEPVFDAIRWAGVAYLVLLAGQALRSAVRGVYAEGADDLRDPRSAAFSGLRQGFLSNITNPKVLVFYLAVLPQFLDETAVAPQALLLAFTHAVVGLAYLVVLVSGLHRMREWLARRRVRRTLDGLTGVALLGFGVRLATEHA